MNSSRLTHRVAVIGYVYDGERFLLLKRATAPFLWAPPGGRLQVNEDPRNGLIREVQEETGLNIVIVGLVDTWFHEWYGGQLLSLDYVVHPLSHIVRLSDEHVDFRWMNLNDIRVSGWFSEDSPGFKVSDFEKAARIYHCLHT